MGQYNKTKEEWIGFQINNNVVIDKIGEFKRKYTTIDILVIQCNLCKETRELQSKSFIHNKVISCRKCSNRDIPYGKKSGKLTVIDYEYSRYPTNNRSAIHYICKCDCGNEHKVKADIFNFGESIQCKDCSGHFMEIKTVKNMNKNKKRYIKSIEHNAKRRNLCFDINIDYALDLLQKQNNKCFLSGYDISIEDGTASLDRIDNNQGYIKGNVQWVYRSINFMKNTLTQDDFIKLCSAVYLNQTNDS
jgi:hypothetical protein